MKSSLVIGSRGSKLALTQAEWVRARLAALQPTCDIRIEILRTSGDVQTAPLAAIGGKGVFTKELEDALLDNRIDIAVHSLKDLPTSLPASLTIAAICEREDPRDALVLGASTDINNLSIAELPANSVIGTSSPRRLAQLKHLRGDLQVKDLRGNVDTRLRKLDEGHYYALILAAAGLRRLHLQQRITSALSPETMLPAVGQGALGIETRIDDENTIALAQKLDHEKTRLACTAERSLLRALGGGCQLPIAAHAVVEGEEVRLDALVAKTDGSQVIRDQLSSATAAAERLGEELAQVLLRKGAAQLLGTTD
jgi:hydroxymethylbilane synthase